MLGLIVAGVVFILIVTIVVKFGFPKNSADARRRKKKRDEMDQSDYIIGASIEAIIVLAIYFIAGCILENNRIPVWPLIISYIISQATAMMCCIMARYKGYSATAAVWVGGIMGVIGLIYYAGLPYSPEYVGYVLRRIEKAAGKAPAQKQARQDPYDLFDMDDE